MRGFFITFEGGEGSGKSTQIKMLAEAFAANNLPHIVTREPGGTPAAEGIRKLLVTGEGDAWHPVSETLLFYAARLEHVERRIKPALEEGTHVICDRFTDSTLVYQGVGKGLSEPFIQNLHHLTLGNFAPDVTLILDIDPTEGLTRAGERSHNETRFESLPLDFHRRIRAGFLELATRDTKRYAVIDATGSTDKVHARIRAEITRRLGIKL